MSLLRTHRLRHRRAIFKISSHVTSNRETALMTRDWQGLIYWLFPVS